MNSFNDVLRACVVNETRDKADYFEFKGVLRAFVANETRETADYFNF